MAAGSNPAFAQMARSLVDNLSKRGAGPSQTGGSGGVAPDMAQQALASRMNELQGADPGAILRKLTQMKQDTVQLVPQCAFTIPDVTKNLYNVLKGLDAAIKAAEQASTTQKGIEATPIGMSAAQPQGQDMQQQPQQPGGAPPQGPSGGSPFMPGGGM